MKIRYLKYYLLLFILVSGSACSPRHEEFNTTLLTFGTLLNITLYDVTQKQATAAFTQLENDFRHYNHNWSPWVKGALYKINQHLKQGKTYTLSDTMKTLIQQGIVLSKQSQGLFNPTIGNLINLWQFHLHDKAHNKPPDNKAVLKLVHERPSVNNLVLRGNVLSSTNPAVQLSLGAYAKGYGIQLALNTLKRMGIKDAVINAGGDLGVLGTHGSREWNIGIRDPRKKTVIASVKVKSGENVFTSGDYERFYFYHHKRYHHILDPRTGYPATGFSSVTVIDKDASAADAAATALLIAGPGKWFNIARAMKLQYVMLIDDHDNITMNPKMAKRIKLTSPAANHIFISKAL